MNELLWQTILLLVGAFFLGAVLACGLKRRFYYGPAVRKPASELSPELLAATAPTPDAAQPKVEVAARPAAEGIRFERALAGKTPVPAASAPAAAPQPTAPVSAPAPAAPVSAPAAPAQSAAVSQPMPRVSVATGSGAPTSPADGGAAPSDDLTRIRGIDPGLQRALKDLGIRRFEDLARLTPTDVKGLSATLNLGARIDEENWVGQAAVLATGGETYFSRRRDRGIPVPETASPAAAVPSEKPAPSAQPASVPAGGETYSERRRDRGIPAPETASPAVATAEAGGDSWPANDVAQLRSVRSEALRGEDAGRAPQAFGETDDLKRIRGIGVLIEKKLNSLGVTHYEQVANWTGRRHRAHQPHPRLQGTD
jgi:predicted flap endonuclease-1-like 5' DNA nuclease